jgi:hypothetical protein
MTPTLAGLVVFAALLVIGCVLVFWPEAKGSSPVPDARDWQTFDEPTAARLGEWNAWRWLDPLCGSWRSWRRWRGGVWERWSMERGAPMWFGARRRATHSLARELLNDGYERETAEMLARPTLACAAALDVEDWRPVGQHTGEWAVAPGSSR